MRKLPDFISQEEFEKLLSAAKKRYYKLTLLLGFEAGMRISEIVGLTKLYSRCCKSEVLINLVEREDHKKIKKYYCSKCSKELNVHKETYRPSNTDWEILPLSPDNIDLTQHTIKIIAGKGKKDRVVPLPKRVNINAINLLPLKVNRRAIQNYVTSLGKKVLGKHITFHTLRHGFGSHLAGKGYPLHQIQILMGHSRLDTTGVYLHANPKQAVEGARDLF